MKLHTVTLGLSLVAALAACDKKDETQANVTVELNMITPDGGGPSVGTVTLADSASGLTLTPDLGGLTPGPHGFHVHENGSCDPGTKDGAPVAGIAAGGHYDPAATGHHEGPGGAGHKGDLPVLVVDADGTARTAIVAPNLTLADVKGRALMIHAGGDNYADTPAPLGGGGARIACGVIAK